MLGPREGGTIAFAAMLGMSETEYSALAPVILLVTATEVIGAFVMAVLSIAWLRPDKLLKMKAGNSRTNAEAADTPDNVGSGDPPSV